jgi:hypothetical protein
MLTRDTRKMSVTHDIRVIIWDDTRHRRDGAVDSVMFVSGHVWSRPMKGASAHRVASEGLVFVSLQIPSFVSTPTSSPPLFSSLTAPVAPS